MAAAAALTALALPNAAQAHGGEDHGTRLDAASAHRAADLAGVSVTTLERRAARVARDLRRRPGTASSAARAKVSAAAANPGVSGRWSPVIGAPVIPIFEALLPSGKVLMWDSVGDRATENFDNQTFTRAAVYDPRTNTSKRVDVQGANIFCAGFVQLANGNVFVAGGNADRSLNGIRQTHSFDWRTETWSRGADMKDGRWYPSVAALPNGEALIIGGGPTEAEIRVYGGGIRNLPGVQTPSSREYPFVQTATDGRALFFGPGTSMSLIDPFNAGSIVGAGTRDGIHRSYGSYANYDIGRTLVSGGGNVNEGGRASVPTNTAVTIDTRASATAVRPTSAMTLRRRQHSLTVLADGSVLATGGQSTNNGGGLVDLANPTLAAERWSPATGRWTTLAPAAVARQYHSTALLIPDGRVLTGGGGICGDCDRVGYLRRDMELFYPPYLYTPSGQPAARPTVSGTPGSISFDSSFAFSSPQAGQIRKLGLVRLGSPTHGEDQSQRYIPLSFTASGTTITAKAPNNASEAPPGPYMLFAVNAAGTPAIAPILTVANASPSISPAINVGPGSKASGTPVCHPSETPAKAIDGTTGGGMHAKFCSIGQGVLKVDLGSERSVSKLVVAHAGAGGEATSMNARAFYVDGSRTGASWSRLATVAGNTASTTTVTIGETRARYLRLVVTQGEQTLRKGWGTRVFELGVYGAAPDAPVRVWSDPNSQGRSQRLLPGRYEPSRGNLSWVNAKGIRSVDVAPGNRVSLCRTATLTSCVTLGAGTHRTLPAGYDRAVKSIRVAR